VRKVSFGDVKYEAVFTEGSPVLDICAFAKDHHVDLIIMSTHGLTGFKEHRGAGCASCPLFSVGGAIPSSHQSSEPESQGGTPSQASCGGWEAAAPCEM
jgi:hypothetical protein